jgi:hypothetical protein
MTDPELIRLGPSAFLNPKLNKSTLKPVDQIARGYGRGISSDEFQAATGVSLGRGCGGRGHLCSHPGCMGHVFSSEYCHK